MMMCLLSACFTYWRWWWSSSSFPHKLIWHFVKLKGKRQTSRKEEGYDMHGPSGYYHFGFAVHRESQQSRKNHRKVAHKVAPSTVESLLRIKNWARIFGDVRVVVRVQMKMMMSSLKTKVSWSGIPWSAQSILYA